MAKVEAFLKNLWLLIAGIVMLVAVLPILVTFRALVGAARAFFLTPKYAMLNTVAAVLVLAFIVTSVVRPAVTWFVPVPIALLYFVLDLKRQGWRRTWEYYWHGGPAASDIPGRQTRYWEERESGFTYQAKAVFRRVVVFGWMMGTFMLAALSTGPGSLGLASLACAGLCLVGLVLSGYKLVGVLLAS